MTSKTTLTDLLAPVTEEVFFRDYYQRQPLHIAGASGRFASLFSWPALAEVLNSSIFPHPTMKMNRQGQPVKFTQQDQVIEEMRDGTTLILDNADSYSGPLAELCDKLSYEFLTPVRTNAYMSFPGIQAFDNHYDTHDFFILQAAGKKRWFVFEKTVDSPLYFAKSHGVVPPETPPVLEVVLSEGDVLYVPKGMWHYAISTDEPSIHLTLAVFVRTGIDFLTWLTGELREDVNFRREFPLVPSGGVRESGEGHFYEATVRRLSERLSAVLEDGTLAERFEAHMAAHLIHRRRFRFPSDFTAPARLRSATKFARVGLIPYIRVGQTVKIAFHGQYLELEGRFAPLIQEIFTSSDGIVVKATLVDGSYSPDELDEVFVALCQAGLLEAQL